MRAIKLNSRLSFVVFCVLVSFIIPVTALAVDCPCFTEEDVMTYASKPAKFVCIDRVVLSQGTLRTLVVGQYAAGFGVSGDDTNSGELDCSAFAGIGALAQSGKGPFVIFLNEVVYGITWEESRACRDLIELGDPPDCPCLENCD